MIIKTQQKTKKTNNTDSKYTYYRATVLHIW